MNSEDLLFTNTFIDIPDSNISNDNIRDDNFRKYYETSIKSKDSRENPDSPREQVQISRKIEKKTIITIDTKDRNVNMYPDQNNFSSFLGKSFFNVKSIGLVSTEIPNTDTVIKELPVELKNNSISWINEEDIDLGIKTNCIINTSVEDYIDILVENHGIPVNTVKNILFFNGKKDLEANISGFLDGTKQVTAISENTLRISYFGGNLFQGTISIDTGVPIYRVDVKPGNYTATTLAKQLESSLNNVKRRNGEGQYHYFEVTVNLDTDVMLVDSVTTVQLPNNPISTTAASTTITVHATAHGFKSGDRVKMIGVKNVASIPGSILKGDFIVSVLDFNTFTYEINERAVETMDGGGNIVKAGKNAPFRILFESEDTRIQFNTGFPNEDSSISINRVNPVLTKSLQITSATLLPGDIIRLTTNVSHSLEVANKGNISNIVSDGNLIIVTTVDDHLIDVPQLINIRNTNCYPKLDGDALVTPIGPTKFTISGKFITINGNYGEFLFGGDTVQISGLKTSPAITKSNFFYIENIASVDSLDIKYPIIEIDQASIPFCSVNTEQIIISHPSHSFNKLISIENYSGTLTNCKTFLEHNFVGNITDNLQVLEGPSGTNTIDIMVPYHGLNTSETITIKNSNCDPSIDGVFAIQVVAEDILRINFVYATLIPGTCSVISGDSVTISKTNSIPRINGKYNISNRHIINSLSTGSITSTLTTTENHGDWKIGDKIQINNSNTVPSVDGTHYIQNVVNSTTFTIDISEPIVSPGNTGIVINKTRFLAITGSNIITQGTSGIIGRDHQVSFYRITPEVKAVDNIGGMLINALNSRSREILRIIDLDNYVIRIKGSYSEKTLSSGGSDVTISSKNHGYRSVQANTVTGSFESKLFRSISLQGEDYLFLSSPGLNTVINSSGIPDVFAKILLSEAPGNMIYNSFISAPKIFTQPLAKIDTINFKMLTSRGFLFNFNNINWSFSLEIVELVDSLIQSDFSSRSGSTEYSGMMGNSGILSSRTSFKKNNKAIALDTANTAFGVLRYNS